MDARRIPTAVFVVTLFFGVLAKVWRAADLYWETDAIDGFRWLPLGLGSELLVAALLALLVAGIARVNVWLSGLVIGVGGGYLLFWLALNDVSFRLTQVGISYQRLRGDEGVGIKDFHLLSPGDVTPAVVYAVVALVGGAALAALAYRRGPLPRAVFALALVVGAGVYGVDRARYAEQNFGMGESPVLLLVRTYFGAFAGREEAQFPSPLPLPQTKEERLQLLRAQEPQPPSTTPTRATPTVQNGILFFSEGVPRKHTSLESDEDITPHLIELLKEKGGLEFENYYTTYHKSIAAIYTMTCADVPPPNAQNIMEINPRIDCGSLPEEMSKNGIHVGLFHGGDFGFYDKLQLLGARGFEIQKDARSLAQKGTWENGWGIDDRTVVDAALAWIDSLPKGARFFAVIIPITAHYPYDIPPDVASKFPGGSSRARFDSAVHFLDEAFYRLNKGLETRGLADDTAVLYTADHGETVAERPRASAGRRLAYEPSLHIPFALIAPKVFPTWQKNARVGSHVDLLPTFMDLLGLPKDDKHLGQSLLSPDYEPRRVFIGANNGPRYVGFLDGKQKFFVNRYSGDAELYDLVKDPYEQHNLAVEQKAKADRLVAEAIAFADGQLAHLKSAPRISGDIDVQALLLAHAAVRVQHDIPADGTAGADAVSCVRDDVDTANKNAGDQKAGDPKTFTALPFRRTCPGVKAGPLPSPFVGTALARAGRTRDCVLVNVPDGGGSVDIVLDVNAAKDDEDIPADGGARPLHMRDWLPFLTRVRAQLTNGATDDGKVTVTAFGDGKQGQEKTLKANNAVRVTFPSSQERLVVRVSGEAPLAGPVCLTFTESAWRTEKRATKPDVDHDDDQHGAAPKDD